MAGYYSSNTSGGNPNLSREEKILCSVDRKWERMDQFSNNELKKYADAKRMRKVHNARCRKHTQAPRLELTCSSCEERKPREDFSNAQRKEDADRRRCRLCVDYTETIDDFQNLAIPDGDVAPDNYKFENSGHCLASNEEPDEGLCVGGLVPANGARTADRGRGQNVALTSSILNCYNDADPHFSQKGEYNPSSAPTDTASVGSDETRRPRRQPQQYIAYGPNGQKQQRAESIATASETASVSTSATSATGTTATATNRSGWVKISGRKVPVRAPDLLTQGKIDENFAPKRYDYSDSGSDDEC